MTEEVVDAKAALLSQYAALKKARRIYAEGMHSVLREIYPPLSPVRWSNSMGSISSGTVEKVLDHEHLLVVRGTDLKAVRVLVTSLL